MGLKEFFRPTKVKIIFSVILLIIAFFYVLRVFPSVGGPHPITAIMGLILSGIFIFIEPMLNRLIEPILYRVSEINSFLGFVTIFAILIIVELFYLYLISCALSKLWGKKKYYKLLVVLILVIMIFPFFLPLQHHPPSYDISEPLSEILENCNKLCDEIEQTEPKMKADAIWEYCTYTTALSKTDYAKVINKNLGENIFCRDKTYCFNLPEAQCKVENNTITPKYCLETMCRNLMKGGYMQAQAEQIIKERVPHGTCNLRKDTTIKVGREEKYIDVPTWWEKYFENPDCSEFASGS